MTDNKSHRLFDVRTVERNISKGLITREDYQAYLNSLPDAGSAAKTIDAEFKVGVLGDDKRVARVNADE